MIAQTSYSMRSTEYLHPIIIHTPYIWEICNMHIVFDPTFQILNDIKSLLMLTFLQMVPLKSPMQNDFLIQFITNKRK